MPAVTSGPNQWLRFKCMDHPTVLILFVEHLLSPLTFSLLCTHVQLGRDPLIYGKDPSFTLSLFLSLTFSLLTVRFKPKNPHSGLNPKAIGHKRGPLLPHTLTSCGSFLHHLLIFLLHFCFLLVQFPSWRSWRT